MDRISLLTRRYGFDALLVLAAIVGFLEVALERDSVVRPQTSVWLAAPAIAVLILPLLARRRWPFAAPAALWSFAAALSFVDGRVVSSVLAAYLAGIAAAVLLGQLPDVVQSRVGLAIVLGGAATVVFNDPTHTVGGLVFIPMVFGLAWLAGFALRERATRAEAAEDRAAQAERERETAARVAVAEERARIARELHDVVAHSVSVMVLQVGAVRHRLPLTSKEDKEALQNVEEAGRNALTEMRRLLGAMRSEDEDVELTPQPGLDDLEALLAEVGRAGLPVRLHVEGDRIPLPRGVDLSAYRIVQEGLTNALKHARAGQADVTIQYGPGELRIEVRDDGQGASTANGLGHGLVGIRERIKIFGGDMTAGRSQEGGFVLRTRLPLPGGR